MAANVCARASPTTNLVDGQRAKALKSTLRHGDLIVFRRRWKRKIGDVPNAERFEVKHDLLNGFMQNFGGRKAGEIFVNGR